MLVLSHHPPAVDGTRQDRLAPVAAGNEVSFAEVRLAEHPYGADDVAIPAPPCQRRARFARDLHTFSQKYGLSLSPNDDLCTNDALTDCIAELQDIVRFHASGLLAAGKPVSQSAIRPLRSAVTQHRRGQNRPTAAHDGVPSDQHHLTFVGRERGDGRTEAVPEDVPVPSDGDLD